MMFLRLLFHLFVVFVITLTMAGCGNAAGNKIDSAKDLKKGAARGMKTYYMGRFAIDVPAEFRLAVQDHTFRLVEIEEFQGSAVEKKWQEHLDKIQALRKPRGINKIIIKEKSIDGLGKNARAVLYYSDRMADDECNWDVFVSYETTAALFKLKGLLEKEDAMLNWVLDVAHAYRPRTDQQLRESGFFTQYGVIHLPYKRQEKTYARFEGPKDVVIKIEMHEIHKISDREGIMNRTAAAMASGLAGALDIQTLRSRKKTIHGFDGEEEIIQGNDGRHKNVSFDWEFLGRLESGDYPMVQITMDTKADNLDAKIAIWDKAIESFRPAGR